MTIPGVGQLTTLIAFVAAIDDPSRIRRSRDIGAYSAFSPGGINRARLTTSASSRNAVTGGCEAVALRVRNHGRANIVIAISLFGLLSIAELSNHCRKSSVGLSRLAVLVPPLPVTYQTIVRTVVALRDLNLQLRRMLEADGGWCTYLKPRCDAIDASQKDPALKTVIDRKVDAIMVSTRLIEFLRYRQDQSLDELGQSASGAEWRRYEIGEGQYLLHRELHLPSDAKRLGEDVPPNLVGSERDGE
jgi:hypothetical protein